MFFSLTSRRLSSIAAPSIVALASYSYGNKAEASAHVSTPASQSNLVVLSGTANHALSEQIAGLLNTPLLDVTTKRFSDGEINCVINESIRGKDVFIIQTCAAPVNDNVMELLLTVAAARRAGANTVTTVIPYFGYKYHRRYRYSSFFSLTCSLLSSSSSPSLSSSLFLLFLLCLANTVTTVAPYICYKFHRRQLVPLLTHGSFPYFLLFPPPCSSSRLLFLLHFQIFLKI